MTTGSGVRGSTYDHKDRGREKGECPALMRLCFVKGGAVGTDGRSPATDCGKRKTPSGENHIGVWRWSREELRLVLAIQHTNNTHTVEQHSSLPCLSL